MTTSPTLPEEVHFGHGAEGRRILLSRTLGGFVLALGDAKDAAVITLSHSELQAFLREANNLEAAHRA